jgi:hypothetical protein
MISRRYDGDPIFIGGDGRSGTTLLSLVLDSHPLLCVGPELHFNSPENLGPYVLECCDLLIAEDPRAFGKGLKENPERKLGVQFAKRCHRFGLEFAELKDLVTAAMQSTRSNLKSFDERCALINMIGDRRRAARNAERWGIKIMREIARASNYARLWPRAQFIHIIRDGRDVAASQLTDHGKWGYDDVSRAAKGWVQILDKTRALARKLPMLEVRYEDLVLEPEPTIRRLLAFLDLPWDDALLHHSEVEHSLYAHPYNHPSISTVVKPINDSAIGRYQRDLEPAQIEAFDRIAGRRLADYGYQSGG